MGINEALGHIDANQDSIVSRLSQFLEIPSISTDPDKKADIQRAAEWVCNHFKQCGIAAEIVPTDGHPAVIADTGPAESGPTILVYGHYDVQPVGERTLWNSEPFSGTVVNGKFVARGAADDKGQVMTHLFAAEAWMKSDGKLPVRVKFLVEGEEEISSPNLEALLRTHKDRLACDYIVISDTAKFNGDIPAITYGTKGLVYKEVRLTGPARDLHSGAFGGTVANPGNVLAGLIASLKDSNHRVTIPGFYDDVVDISQEEKEAFRRLPFDESAYLRGLGSPLLQGESGYTTLERKGARPTLDVNGIYGGYMGPGASTIIPSWCAVKVSMRLVPNQDPDKISQAFDAAVRKYCGQYVTVEITNHGKAAAYMAPLDSPGMKAALRAIEKGYGVKPLSIREGGSLPILPMFKKILGADSIMMGFSYPDCNLHGPNEFFHVKDLMGGTRSSAVFFEEMSKVS